MIVVIFFLIPFITIFAGATESFATISTILACGIYYYFTMYGYKNGEYTLNDYIEETATYKFKRLFNSKINTDEHNSLMNSKIFYENDVKEMLNNTAFKTNLDYQQCFYLVMETEKAMNKHISYAHVVRNCKYITAYDFYNLLIEMLCPPLGKEYWKRMGVDKALIAKNNVAPFMRTLANVAYEKGHIDLLTQSQLLKYYSTHK